MPYEATIHAMRKKEYDMEKPDSHTNAIEIAVLKEQVGGLREQQKAHAAATEKRFDAVDGQLEILVATLNKGKGAYGVLFLVSGFIGAAIIQGASWVFGKLN